MNLSDLPTPSEEPPAEKESKSVADVGATARRVKVFVSWSGPRSKKLAQAVRDWIPLVLHFVEPWMSDKDISAGERWSQSVGKQLESCNFGIMCITRENMSSQWVLFEAGSLAKSLSDSKVIPLLLDVDYSEISGPLAQFQAKKADRDGMRDVIESVNRTAGEIVPQAQADKLFAALWPDFEDQLGQIPSDTGTAAAPARSQHEILEDLVAGVRTMDVRMRRLFERLEQAEYAAYPPGGRDFSFTPREVPAETRHGLQALSALDLELLRRFASGGVTTTEIANELGIPRADALRRLRGMPQRMELPDLTAVLRAARDAGMLQEPEDEESANG